MATVNRESYAAAAEKMNVRRYFTPVIGNEVTNDMFPSSFRT